MEHLPAAQERHEFGVKFVADGEYQYDQRGFLGFPARMGVDQSTFETFSREKLDEFELAEFIQASLFFGLISKFMPTPGQINVEDFVRETETEHFITTRALNESLLSWRDSVMKNGIERDRFMKLTSVINTTKCALNTYDDYWTKWPRVHDDRLVLGCLAETLQWAVSSVQDYVGTLIRGWSATPDGEWIRDRTTEDLLETRGWCPYEINMLEGLLKGSSCGLYYASTFRRKPSKSHGRCDHWTCELDKIDSRTYRMQHVDEDCNFLPLQPDETHVKSVIHNAKVPLLS